MTSSGWELVRQGWGGSGSTSWPSLTRTEIQGVIAHLDQWWVCFQRGGGLAEPGLFVPGCTGASLKPAPLPSRWAVYSSLGLKSVYFKKRERLRFTTGSIGSSSTVDGAEGFLSWSRQPSHTQGQNGQNEKRFCKGE